MAKAAEAKISAIERLAQDVDGWVQDGIFEDKVKKADDKQRMSYLVALNYIIARRREEIFIERFKEKYGIEHLTYNAGELNRVPEKEIIQANKDFANKEEKYLQALKYFFT